MEEEIEEKLQDYYDFYLNVHFKDFRYYDIYCKITKDSEFTIPVIYDSNYTFDWNIYNIEDKTKFMGGSGSACISLATFGFIINKMLNKKYKKVLLVGTGALHSSTSVQQKANIPIIAHALEIEVII